MKMPKITYRLLRPTSTSTWRILDVTCELKVVFVNRNLCQTWINPQTTAIISSECRLSHGSVASRLLPATHPRSGTRLLRRCPRECCWRHPRLVTSRLLSIFYFDFKFWCCMISSIYGLRSRMHLPTFAIVKYCNLHVRCRIVYSCNQRRNMVYI